MLGVDVAGVIVMDVAEIEVRLEVGRIEQNRPLVERLRLGQLVARVADVGEVDDRRDQFGIVLERAAVGLRRLFLPLRRPIVQQRSHEEVLLGAGERTVPDGPVDAPRRRRRGRSRLSARMRAGCGVDAEVERQLARAQDACRSRSTPRNESALLQLGVDLPQAASDR